MSRTYDRILNCIQRDHTFDGHVIEKVGPTTWVCHKNKSSIRSFYISTQPGAMWMVPS